MACDLPRSSRCPERTGIAPVSLLIRKEPKNYSTCPHFITVGLFFQPLQGSSPQRTIGSARLFFPTERLTIRATYLSLSFFLGDKATEKSAFADFIGFISCCSVRLFLLFPYIDPTVVFLRGHLPRFCDDSLSYFHKINSYRKI